MKTYKKPVVVLGPTASGKTSLAAHLAARIGGEILSIDSRQVYRGMDIGTGKDLEDLVVGGKAVPIHLVDIADAGSRLSLFDFLQHFDECLAEVAERGSHPILCGGTGMYMDAIVRGYRLARVPEDPSLRKRLEDLDMEELTDMLKSFGELHNTTDTLDRERLLRAIEIRTYQAEHPGKGDRTPLDATVFGTSLSTEEIRVRITKRLEQRLAGGMIQEVKGLVDKGLSLAELEYYGLEYRYIGRYLTGSLTYEDMFRQLNTAIHRFAKRQMTWFRRMERKGVQIHWIDATHDIQSQTDVVTEILKP